MKKLIFAVLLLGLPAFSQVQVAPFISPAIQFLDNNGAPLAGGKVCTFSAGTSSPLASYSDLGVSLNQNPVILDSAGRATIYLTAASYKIVIAASTANSLCSPAIKSQDNVTWNNLATSLTSLTVTGNSALMPAVAATNVANQNSPTLCIQGFYFNVTSLTDQYCLQDILGTGTNPTSTFTLTHSGSSGASTFSIPGNVSVGGTTTHKGNTIMAGPIPWIDVTAPAYGCVGDGATDNTACLNAAILVAENNRSATIFFPCGNYRFLSKPNSFGTGIWLLGCGSAGSTTGFGTYLMADYTEASCASATTCNGFLTWDGSFVIAGGTGGGMRNIVVYKQPSQTAGAAIRLTGADDNHRAGWWRADHVLIHGSQSPAGTWSYGLLIDGHNNTTPGTQGIRDIVLTDLWITNTTITDGSAWFINCAKCSWYGGEVFAAGGTNPGVTITGTGGAGASSSNSPENTLVMTISGDLVIDQASNVRAISEHVLGNLTITANAFKSSFIGRVDGTVSNSSITSLAYVEGGGGTNNALHIQGAPMGASFDSSAPTGTAGRLYTRDGATSGCVFFGDGSFFECMASPGVVNFNAGNTATYNMLGTGTRIKVPIHESIEGSAPAGVGSSDLLWGDSSDHMWHQNLNNTGDQHVPIVLTLTAQYTNSTTGFTTVGTPNIAFTVAASRNYTATCHLYYQAAATGGLNIEFTGPASPTSVIYSLNEPLSSSTFAHGVSTAFSSAQGTAVTTATTNFDAVVSFSLINGANAGTVTLLAKSSAAVQLQIQAGSFCQVQ